MIRRFNYTNRKRIRRDHVSIRLQHRQGAPESFEADLQLTAYEFPVDSRVFVEAYRKVGCLRFPYGTVGQISPPSDRSLSQLPEPQSAQFRVKVVAPGSPHGKLIGVADKILPMAPEDLKGNRMSLLPVRKARLGEEIWRIDYETGHFTLLVNERIEDHIAFVQQPEFQALAYPAVLRHILRLVLLDGEDVDLDDEEEGGAAGRWLRFAISLPGTPTLPDSIDGSWSQEHREEWVDDATQAFCNRFGFATRLLDAAERD